MAIKLVQYLDEDEFPGIGLLVDDEVYDLETVATMAGASTETCAFLNPDFRPSSSAARQLFRAAASSSSATPSLGIARAASSCSRITSRNGLRFMR